MSQQQAGMASQEQRKQTSSEDNPFHYHLWSFANVYLTLLDAQEACYKILDVNPKRRPQIVQCPNSNKEYCQNLEAKIRAHKTTGRLV
jgi:hypothetical protein